MARRQCQGTTKAGKPCQSPPLKPGTVIEGVAVKGNHCRTHDPDLPESARIQGAQPGSGPKPKPSIPALMRQAVEDHVLAILTPHFRVLGYEPLVEADADGHSTVVLEPIEAGGAKLYGESRDGVIKMSESEDLGAQMKAAEALIDRVYGRPKQTTELAGEVKGGGGDTIFIVGEQSDEWHERVTAIAAEAEARKQGSPNGSGNGHGG